VVVIHSGVDKRLEPLLTAGTGEVAGGAFWHGYGRFWVAIINCFPQDFASSVCIAEFE
jgi:hypothetical protein